MKAGGQRAILLTCLAIALLALPALASAKPGYLVFPGSHEAEMHLEGSNGYSIDISKAAHGFVEMYVDRGSGVAIYLVRHSQLGGDDIGVEFPGVGRASVRFHPVGPPETKPGFFKQCKGGQTILQKGYFEGTIQIRGEQGYTAADAPRARGEVVTRSKEICKRSIFEPDEPSRAENVTRLLAFSRSKGKQVAFSANTVDSPPGTLTFFFGYVTEQREGMQILRQVVAHGPEKTLTLGDDGNFPSSATVDPPSPFHGSATFQRQADGQSTWTGPLSVEMPGAGRVDLAGQGFTAKLCRDAGCRSGEQAIVGVQQALGRFRRR